MRSTTSILLALVCTLAACGSDGPGPVDSGLPPEKAGTDLTADETEQLCLAAVENRNSQNTTGEKKKFACVFLAVAFADEASFNRDECETIVQMCLKDSKTAEDDDDSMCALNFDPVTCEATVADIEACLTEQNETSGAAVRKISCSNIEKTLADDNDDNDVDGPACAKIKATCPGIAVGE